MKNKKDIIDGWIKIQKDINEKSISNLRCPNCDMQTLKFEDISIANAKKLERNIY